jgi:acyl-CoA thioesterase
MADQDLSAGATTALDDMFRSDPLLGSLGASLVSWSSGAATVECEIAEQHTNFIGGAHGGILFSLGDMAMSFASNSHGRIAVAVQLDVTYHRGARAGDCLRAVATERTRSRRFGSYELELRCGDVHVASMHGITYRTDDWHLGEDEWTAEWRTTH